MNATATLEQLQQREAAKPPANLAEMKPKDKVAYLLQQKHGEIMKMLPKHLHAERLLKVAQIAATTTPGLLECDVPSLIGAIGQCAQMGLEPNTVLGHAYLVPFNTKDKAGRWVKKVQVIIGYKGLIDLARRSGQIVSIAAHEVCEGDQFELVYGLDEKLAHTPAMGERGEIIGFYAIAKLKDGGYCFEFMSRLQIDRVRDTKSAGAYKEEWVSGKKTGKRIPANHPWWTDYVEMGRKTVIRRLAKYLPLSVEFQTAVVLDNLAEAGKDQHLERIEGDFFVIDNEAGETPQGANEPEDQQPPEQDSAPETAPQSTAKPAVEEEREQSGEPPPQGQPAPQPKQPATRPAREPGRQRFDLD